MNKSNMTVDVLGCVYNIVMIDKEYKNPPERLEEESAFVDVINKVICIDRRDEGNGDIGDPSEFEFLMRHELAHAFLYESGLEEYSNDETLVNWIAIQSYKIFKCFEKLELF